MHEFLKTDQLGHIINQVNDEISMLKNALNEPINKNVESNVLADILDRAALEEERKQQYISRYRKGLQLKALQRVKFRLQKEPGEYGYCETYGIEIQFKRLVTVPTAENCCDCQSIIEVQNRYKCRRTIIMKLDNKY